MKIKRSGLARAAIGGLLFVAAAVALSGFLILPHGFEAALLVWSGSAALIVLIVPILARRRYDLFEPLNVVILAVLVGVTLKVPYIYWSANEDAIRHLLLGREPEFLLNAAGLILVGITAFSVGYMVRRPAVTLTRFRIFRANSSARRTALVSAALLVISLVSTCLFINSMGIALGGTLDAYSSKRFLDIEGSEHRAVFGYLQWGAALSVVVFYVLFAQRAKNPTEFGLVRTVELWIALIFSLAFPILTSSRVTVLLVLLGPLIIGYYMKDRISPVKPAIAFACAAAILIAVTALRNPEYSGGLAAVNATSDFAEISLGGRHSLDLTKTGHIIDAVPSIVPFQYGRTLISWLFAPVPRTIWPGKPALGVGPMLGPTVFGQKIGGVPPGFIAELYMNFGAVAVPIGMFLVGVLLQQLYLTFRPLLAQRNVAAVTIYASIVFPSSYGLMNGDFSKTVVSILLALLPVVAVFLLIRKPTPGHMPAYSQ